jgi:hypothetical protein
VRSQDHDHVPTVLLGCALHEPELGDIGGQPLQQPESEFGTRLLPTPEHDGDLDLVPGLEEANDVTLLGLVVVRIDLRPELHFFDDRQDLVSPGLPGLLRALVLELSVVHELADGWAGIRSDLDKIEIGFLRQSQGFADRNNADLLTLGSDEANLGNADPVVNAWFDAD